MVDEELTKKVSKIEENFVRLTEFVEKYSEVISKKNLTKGEVTYLKSLERQEMSYALKNLSSVYLSLKNALFEDILKKANLKNVKRVIPVLGDLFKKLFTNDSQRYNLKTSFEMVNVRLIKRLHSIEFMIYHDGKPWSYDEICQNLDSLFLNNKRRKVIDSIIYPIITYLKTGKVININEMKNYYEKQHSDDKEKNAVIQEIFNIFTASNANIRSLNFGEVTEKDVSASAASLSGILILAEACQYRNPTFGKLERNAMKTVLRLSQNNCTNSFSKVFNNKTGRYIPAHSGGGNLDTQLLLSYNFDNDSVKARFLPIPVEKTKTEEIKKLFVDIIIGEESLEEIYSKLYPFKYPGFLQDMTAKDHDEDTIKAVFGKLNSLFPNMFSSTDSFINGNRKVRNSTVQNIINFKPKDQEIDLARQLPYRVEKSTNSTLLLVLGHAFKSNNYISHTLLSCKRSTLPSAEHIVESHFYKEISP